MPIRCEIECCALAHNRWIRALACCRGRLQEVDLEARDAWVRIDQLRATHSKTFFAARLDDA
jgi:hypothetical protein